MKQAHYGRRDWVGTDGDDFLRGGRGDDVLNGGKGFDVIHGGKGDDTLHGGTQNDFVFGDRGDDVLHGDSGPATGRGDLGADRLSGGWGNDTVWASEGLDALNGGDGYDTFAFKFSNPQTPLAVGTGAAFAAIEDFKASDDTLAFDVPGLGVDAAGANFVDGSGGVNGGSVTSFFSGAAAASNGERVIVLTDQGFASGALAVQAAQSEDEGDFVIYFNTTVNAGSLLVVSAPDTATSIARFTDVTTLQDFQAIGFTADDFIFI